MSRPDHSNCPLSLQPAQFAYQRCGTAYRDTALACKLHGVFWVAIVEERSEGRDTQHTVNYLRLIFEYYEGQIDHRVATAT